MNEFNSSPFDNFAEWHRKKILGEHLKNESFWDENSPIVKMVRKLIEDGNDKRL